MAKNPIEQALAIKTKLNSVSQSFCLAKWQQVSLLLQNGLSHSCHHPAPHSIPTEGLHENPSLLHNTPHKLLERKQMFANEKPEGCTYCWKIEANGGISDRFFKSAEPWAIEHFKEITSQPLSSTHFPSYLEVSFDHHCNLKCAYCSPQSSSRWAEEIEKFGAYPTSIPFNDPIWFKKNQFWPLATKVENPFVEAFWQWWPSLKKHLSVFRITGGEPLLSSNTWKILDELIANPQPNLELAINTNLSIPQASCEQLIEKLNLLQNKIKKFTLFASIDCLGEKGEFIRFGLDTKLFQENAYRVLRNTTWQIRFTTMATISALSIYGLKDLLKWNLRLRKEFTNHSIGLDTPGLQYPSFLSLQALPTPSQVHLLAAIDFLKLNNFTEREIFRLERLPRQSSTEHHKDLQLFLKEYDRRRHTDWQKIFPELATHLAKLD